ncbi:MULTISPECIES: hypothetical protein [unclassified Novosphingobium]|uniref:hypothetical protein n=1 Tax=unclassified Novosphingobium TaxID=2644732 RepID=UPI000AE019EF|nr:MULTISPECIES: hypothetical protein [unclassified Novosphingobium]MBN9144123.1 hypothetical protein [Novosphingobium sp.]MDR6708544.1 hypothetical protein [Novosphingobium sp. 1748]
MAIWQNDANGERFDDGAALLPGEEGFSRAGAEAHFGADVDFSYVGTPNWAPAAPEDDD